MCVRARVVMALARSTATRLLLLALGTLLYLHTLMTYSSSASGSHQQQKQQQHPQVRKLRGLNPELAHRYVPVNGRFTCLDQSGSIPWDQVNDNYCDCADGSDEPGAGVSVVALERKNATSI